MITPEMRHCAPYELITLQITPSVSTWTPDRSIGYAYKTSNGIWKLNGNFSGTLAVGQTSVNFSIAGVLFKNVTNFYQAVTIGVNGGTGAAIGNAFPGNNYIGCSLFSSSTIVRISFDVELDRKPDWIQEV